MQPLYLIICGNHIPPYAVERNLADMTRDRTVAYLAGEFRDLHQVIEIGTGRDVTKEIAWLISQAWDEAGEPLTTDQYEFVELHCGFAAARAFLRVAA